MTPREETIMRRFRHMMTDSGVLPHGAPDADLLEKLVGNTPEEKLASAEALITMVPETYWQFVEQG